MNGYGNSALTHDFFAYNASNEVWNGSAFVTWSDANFATYRITATQIGTSGQFVGTLPSGAARYELRERGASLALSYVVWATSVGASGSGASAAEVVAAINADSTQTAARTNAATAATEVVKIPRASTALTAGASARRTKVAATSTTLDESLGATP